MQEAVIATLLNTEQSRIDLRETVSLHTICVSEGVPVYSIKTGPVQLTDPSSCWYVVNGTVDVYVTALDKNANPTGSRTYARAANAGDLLFGINQNENSAANGLIARGGKDAALVKLPLARFEMEPAIATDFERGVNDWIEGLTAALIGNSPSNPEIDEEISENLTSLVKPQNRYGPAQETLWILGADRFIYCDKVEVDTHNGVFPLSRDAWIVPVTEGSVTTLTTAQVARDGLLQPALAKFHKTVLHSIAINTDLNRSNNLERLRRREQRDNELLETALSDALVVNRQAKSVIHEVKSADHLTKVIAHLATILNAGTPKITSSTGVMERSQSLKQLLDSAGLTSREVELSGQWWRSAGAPLVAWTKAGKPLAMWSSNRSRYSCFDPETGHTVYVDSRLAETLSTAAHAVYPTLLKDRIKFRDLVKTGLLGGKRDLAFLVLFGLLGALVGLIVPSVTAFLINTAIPQSAGRLVVEMSAVLFSVAIIVGIFQVLQATALLRMGTIFESQAQAALWHRLMRLPTSFFRDYNSGNLTMRAMGLSQIRTVLSHGVITVTLGGIFSSLNIVVMIIYGGWLAIPALLLTLLTIAVAIVANLLKLPELRKAIAAQDELAGQSTQALTAIKKLRVAGAGNRISSRLIHLHNRQRMHDYNVRSVENVLRSFNVIIPVLASAVFYAMVMLLFDEPPATGDFVAFTTAFGSFIVGIIAILNSVPLGLIVLVLYERLKPILEKPPETAAGSSPPGKLLGRIEMNRITYRYLTGGTAVVDDVSLKIEPGQFVAIVGPSGSGKSTLLRLLLGFEQPQRGSVSYDGKDLSKLDIGAVRQQFGTVLQNAEIIGGSIFENIAGARSLTMEEAWEAARKAGLDQTINAMPMQMHTAINDSGTISGGERQRLMLARALAGNPSILFMDEATSALDNITQAIVADSLSNLELTRVVVAHRLSTVKDADVIFVMQNGKIAEVGNAETLLESGGLFSEFVARQRF